MRFWLKATVICGIWFIFLSILFYFYGGTITCLQLHNTTDWRGKCGYSPTWTTIGGFLFVLAGVIVTIVAIWAGLVLRKRLRQMGEIIASGSKIPKPEHPTDGEFQDWDKEDPGRDPSS